ncbi:DUF6415 family natural product biosynthesis protein [Streptomyces katsurahamanus]|uniref:Uncharacterized protein n=1 Tax=Streptomyces katsurahamanus TaxID=2577098 RepID=A0ABW9NQ35_9ACTN|nr:DUF6415 family natural product biosynthesis protein [Streptomyces katsurahamanus]MQS35421.1 hypothetical protein [Streptomyces katsurahamanus]
MRDTAGRLLSPDAAPLPAGELARLIELLRGYVELLVPEVRRLAAAASPVDPAARVAEVGAAEAVRRLNAGTRADAGCAERLARSVVSLCHHFETLSAEDRR